MDVTEHIIANCHTRMETQQKITFPSDTATCQGEVVQGEKKKVTEGVFINTVQAAESSFALTVN